MGYQKYKKEIMPLCPVAIRQGQDEVHAPGHRTWGTVTCDCGEKFFIGPNLIFGSRLTDVEAAKRLEEILLAEHKAGSKHRDAYEIQD